MNRGFMSLGVVVAIAITAVVTAGGSYAVYKVNELEQENEEMAAELEKEHQKVKGMDEPIATSSPQETDLSTTSADGVASDTDATEEEKNGVGSQTEIQTNTDLSQTNVGTGNIVDCYGQKIEDNCAEEGKIFYCAPDYVSCLTPAMFNSVEYCNGKTYDTSVCTNDGVVFVCPSVGKGYCNYPEQKEVASESEDMSTTLNNILDDAIDDMNAKEEARKEAEEEKLNSPECKEARNELEELQEEHDELWEEYASNDDAEALSKAADLSIDIQFAQNEMYAICY